MKRVFEGVKKINKIKSKNIKFKNQEFKLDKKFKSQCKWDQEITKKRRGKKRFDQL